MICSQCLQTRKGDDKKLWDAASKGDVKTVQTEIRQGSNVNYRDQCGKSFTHSMIIIMKYVVTYNTEEDLFNLLL